MVPLAAGMALSLAPTVAKWFTGRSQRRQAQNMNIQNPGFVMNNELIDNARILGDRYSNYNLPGLGNMRDNVRSGYATAFSRGVEGATSGGDVLDLATSLGGAEAESMQEIDGMNAQGRDQALMQYLNANSAAGNEPVRKNIYELEEYQRKIHERAALDQSGAMNQYGALTEGAGALSTGVNAMFGQQLSETATGGFKFGKSAWAMMMDAKNARILASRKQLPNNLNVGFAGV